MNVISGKYKGRKLESVKSLNTRPTLARVKESLFCMIDSKISNSVVLDLFAGSGALGIECLSRGAKKVYFCDNSQDAVKVINKNLKNINGDYEVFNTDFKIALQKLNNVIFDLVFLDPFYDSNLGEFAISYLIENKMLNPGSIIVFEHSSKKDLPIAFKNCIMIKQKVYGDKAIDIFNVEDNER